MPGLAVSLLRSELDLAVFRLETRLDGLQRDEFFWQPVPGCWTVSRRGEAATPTPVGRGDWVIDDVVPDPDPAPCTTIAWRLCHLVLVDAVYYDHLFGDRALGWDDVAVPDGPAAAVDLWLDGARRFSSALAPLSDDDLRADVEIEWWGGAASVNAGICQLAGELAAGFVTHPTSSNPRYLETVWPPSGQPGAGSGSR